MTPLDWIAGAVLLASLVLGVWRGLVYELLSVLSWVAAFVVAQWLAPTAAEQLLAFATGETVRFAIGFALVFIAVVFAGGLLAWLTGKLIEKAGLRPADRALGAVFGLIRGAVLLLAVAALVHLAELKAEPWWKETMTADATTAGLRSLKPVLPETFGLYLPD